MKKLYKLEDGSEVEFDKLPEVVALEAAKTSAETRLAEIEADKRKDRIAAIRTAAVAKGLSQPSIDKLVAFAESTDSSAIVLSEGAAPTDLLGAVESLVTELEVVPITERPAGEQDPPADGVVLSETDKKIGKMYGLTDEQLLAAKKSTGEEG